MWARLPCTARLGLQNSSLQECRIPVRVSSKYHLFTTFRTKSLTWKQLQNALHLMKTKIALVVSTSPNTLTTETSFKESLLWTQTELTSSRHFFGFKVKYPDTVLRSMIHNILILTQTVPVYLHRGLTQILALGFDKGHIKQTLLPVS